MNRYMPNDSPFGDAYAAWLRDDHDTALYAVETPSLDEFASCARMYLGMPHYADDRYLARYLTAVEGELEFRGFALYPYPVRPDYAERDAIDADEFSTERNR